MLLFLTQVVGWLLAHTPEALLRLLANTLGGLTYYGYGGRRKVMLQGLRQSFPERADAWHRRIARTSCIRLMETALLSLAAPFLSENRIRASFDVTARTTALFSEQAAAQRPLVFGTAHFAYWEGLTWLPLRLAEGPRQEIVTVFRPLRNPALNEWLQRTRERFGIRLLSRRSGLHGSLHVLQRRGIVALLFDQSAGSHGFLTKFLGRDCSTTPLPGLLVEKTGADVGLIYARRRSFWRFTIDAERVVTECTPEAVTLALNRALESLLTHDENLCASWLWMHQRWRILDRPGELEKLIAKRGGLIG